MKRRSGIALAVAAGALLAGAGMSMGSVSAAPPSKPGPVTTVYSDTFAPFSRFGDGDSLNHYRYASLSSGIGPGASPNFFSYRAGSGHDAFFNSPDLTISTKPMSAVSAEVCLKVTDESVDFDPEVFVVVGVQDGVRNYLLAQDAKGNPRPQVVAGDPSCVKLTFATPVKLENRPHLVAVLDMKLKDATFAEVEGVTYILQPTAAGDVAPVAQTTPALPGASLQDR